MGFLLYHPIDFYLACTWSMVARPDASSHGWSAQYLCWRFSWSSYEQRILFCIQISICFICVLPVILSHAVCGGVPSLEKPYSETQRKGSSWVLARLCPLLKQWAGGIKSEEFSVNTTGLGFQRWSMWPSHYVKIFNQLVFENQKGRVWEEKIWQ